MGDALRCPVGRTALAGYLVIRPVDEAFFRPLPADQHREIQLVFEDGQRVAARLLRARSARAELKVAYTGKTGAAFRAWLKRRFPARKSSKVRGVLVLERLAPDRFAVRTESVSQAEVELLSPGARHHLAGARPVCVLHPAMLDLESLVKAVPVPAKPTAARLRRDLERRLAAAGWESIPSVGGGLALAGGLGRSRAQLHLVTVAAELYPALVAMAAGFELGGTDLGVLLVADGRLAEGLRSGAGTPAASLARALREVEQLAFLVRGPTVLIGLGTRKEIR